MAAYDDQAAAGGFIAVYPNGATEWNSDTRLAALGTANWDVIFISKLIDRLTADYRIDKARIFAGGLSSGAEMAYLLACTLSDRIAGIASIAGAMRVNECSPARPVSILEMHGTADGNIPLGKIGDRNGAIDSVQRWADLDGCIRKPKQTLSGITRTSTWTGCRGGTVVRLEVIVGGQHHWFSSNPADVGQGDEGNQSVAGEPDASLETWAFFSTLARRA